MQEKKTQGYTRKWKIKAKIVGLFNSLTVEPIMCLYIFPQWLSSIAVYNLTFQMACRVNLNLNETICNDLLSTNNSMYEVLVQKEAAKILVWKRPLSTLVPALLVLFIGAYSDKYKIRKPFLLIPLLGELLTTACFFICTYYQSLLPVEVLAASEASITAITGGITTIKVSVYSYIADISSLTSRTTRLGIVQILSSIMSPVALALSGILFSTTGFYGMFSTRTFLFLIGFIYGLIRVKEVSENTKSATKSFCAEFFDPRHVKDTLKVLIVKKNNNRRIKIILLMVAFVIIKGSISAEVDMLFLYTRIKFQWNDVTFGLYNMFDIVMRLIGSMLAISLFSQWFEFDDLLIAIITFVSKIIGNIIFALCPTSEYIYIASVVSLLCDYQTVPIRSLASKLVAEDELGKLQSLFGVCEALAPSIFAPIYSNIYSNTVDFLPGAYYLAGAGGLLPIIPAFLTFYIVQRKNSQKTENQERQKSEIKVETFKYITFEY